MDNTSKQVGQRLKFLREQRGMSQRDLDEATSYSYAYVSRIENGERRPSIRAIREFAAALGVDAYYLETGDEHGFWVYKSKTDLLDAIETEGCSYCRRDALEHGMEVPA